MFSFSREIPIFPWRELNQMNQSASWKKRSLMILPVAFTFDLKWHVSYGGAAIAWRCHLEPGDVAMRVWWPGGVREAIFSDAFECLFVHVDNINSVRCLSHVYAVQSRPCRLPCVCSCGCHRSSGALQCGWCSVFHLLALSFFFCFLAVWTSLTSSSSSSSSGLMCSWDQGPFARLRTFWNSTHSMGWMGKRGALTSLLWKVTPLLLLLLICLGSPPHSRCKHTIYTHLHITTAFILNLNIY